MTMRSTLRLSILAVTAAIAACQDGESSEPIVRPVRFQQAYATGGARVRTFSGVARAAVESPLSFRVPGSIQSLRVSVGSVVPAGQRIAELDPQDFQLRMSQAEAALRQAEAQATNANAEYARVRLLYETNNASRSDLDAARSASESANAAVQAAVNTRDLRELELGYTRLVAPFDGSISNVHVEVNQNVGAGQPIVTETSSDRLEVVISVPGTLIGQMRAGQAVAVTFDALGPDTLAAVVSEVGVAATGAATTFPVTVRLRRTPAEVLAGMAAEVLVPFAATDHRERFVVPSFSVGEDRDGRFVYLVEPGDSGFGIAVRRAVVVGELTSEGLEILSGLNEGDLVITAGVSRITDSLRVRLPGSEAGTAVEDRSGS